MGNRIRKQENRKNKINQLQRMKNEKTSQKEKKQDDEDDDDDEPGEDLAPLIRKDPKHDDDDSEHDDGADDLSGLEDLLDLKGGKKGIKKPASSNKTTKKKPSSRKRSLHGDADEKESWFAYVVSCQCNVFYFLQGSVNSPYLFAGATLPAHDRGG